ncbi:MAG: hypothetical protein GEU93_02120 [Propionibacteriales bacterium]|nr:hypothetical protein [Propionibacteriales bacterium]
MDAYEQLAEIRRLIETARSMPMSASVLVNRADLLDRIEALAQAIPAGGGQFAGRDGAVGSTEAERALAAAHAEQRRMVEQSEVYRVAKAEADKLLSEAHDESEALRRETDEYVDSKFANFEIALTKTLEALSRGRNKLQGRSALDSLGTEDVDELRLPGDPP